MEGNERPSRSRLKALVMLVAVGAIVACNYASKADVESLKKDVAELKVWRDTTGKWEDSLWKSYAHVYICDTPHKAENKCPVGPNHVPPPNNPPK